jgi:hypothetical protein
MEKTTVARYLMATEFYDYLRASLVLAKAALSGRFILKLNVRPEQAAEEMGFVSRHDFSRAVKQLNG